MSRSTDRWRDMRADLAAGLTVAIVALPQSMAYAIIAGAPPAFGLYTSIVSCIVGAFFGSSRHLITGPTNATAIIFASTLAMRGGNMDPVEGILLYTFLIGVVKFSFGLFRLGRLVQYISDSVIVGFTAGAGLLIAGNQLRHFLAVSPALEAGESFLSGLWKTLAVAGSANPYTLVVAILAVSGIFLLQRLDRRIPGPLIVCAAAGVIVYLAGLHEQGVVIAGDIGAIRRSLPPFRIPTFDWAAAERLLGGAMAVSVIGLMEATAISKSLAASSGQRLDSNREFMAQGLANMVGAFFSNFACSGSFTRSALNYQSGAKSRLAGISSGVIVAVALLIFGPLGEKIPIASLAGLLMVVAWQMLDQERLKLAWRAGRESRIVLVATALATVTIRLDYAIGIGVLLSLAFFIKQSSGARMTVLLRRGNDCFQEVAMDQADDRAFHGEIVVLNIIGAMYFGAMDEHRRQMRRVVHAGPRAVVLRLRRVSNIDSSGIASLEGMYDHLREHGIPMTLCGVDDELLHILDRAGLLRKIGQDNVVASQDLVFNSIALSVERAEALASKIGKNGETGM